MNLSDREATTLDARVLFGVTFLVLAVAAILYLGFLDRSISFDEEGLYNPAYMMLHYGRITYPIHGHFDDMVIHPPTHYLALAFLMNTGLSLFHAAAVPPILFFLTLGMMLLFSPFEFPVRVGLLFGAFLAVLVWNSIQTVRPDVCLALAWIAGLVTLEAGRLANWDSKRLFAGSVMLTYAATLHYPGSFCWLGVLVYVVWVAHSLGWHEARRPVTVMLAGVLFIGLPYLLLFLIPFRHEIVAILNQVQGDGGTGDAFQRHVVAYQAYSTLQRGLAASQPLVQTMLAPLWHSRVPAAFIGTPLLFVFRTTRGIALAGLPQVLFIVFGARHKDIRFPGYFTPEMILYLAAVISVATALLIFFVRRTPRPVAIPLLALALATLTGLTLHDRPRVAGDPVRFTRDLNDLDLGRAAARDIGGPDAFIGSTSLGVWYTGGAADFYEVSPEVLYGPTLSIDPKEYFSRFDALVIDQLNSWVTRNKERLGLTSFYLSGDLHIKGFWFDDKRAAPESELSWMMYAAKESPVRGYALREGRMYRFDQAQDGDSVLFSAVCPISVLRNQGQFDSYLTLFFPLPGEGDPRFGPDSTPVIRTLLVSQRQFKAEVLPVAGQCKVRDQIAGRMSPVDSDKLLAGQRANDRTIHFYRSFPTALAGANRLNTKNTSRTPGVVALDTIRAVNPQSHVVWRGKQLDVKTAPTLWWDAASLPIRSAQNVNEGFFYVRGRVLEGVVGISVRGHEVNSILGSEAIWGSHDQVSEVYIPVASLKNSEQLVIRNQSGRGTSEILIEDAALVVEKPVR